MRNAEPSLEFFANSSVVGLESYQLTELNRAANLRKELRQVVEQWIEAEVNARFARLLVETHGDHAPIRPERSLDAKCPAEHRAPRSAPALAGAPPLAISSSTASPNVALGHTALTPSMIAPRLASSIQLPLALHLAKSFARPAAGGMPGSGAQIAPRGSQNVTRGCSSAQPPARLSGCGIPEPETDTPGGVGAHARLSHGSVLFPSPPSTPSKRLIRCDPYQREASHAPVSGPAISFSSAGSALDHHLAARRRSA